MPYYLADFNVLSTFIPIDHIPAHLTSYIRGRTPLSTWPEVISLTATYLVVVFGTREIMKDKAPLRLTTLFRAHNLILSIGSLMLMALIGKEVFSNWLKPEIGTYGSLCAAEAYTERLEFYLILAYYSKYYEYLDTILLVLRKKPLSFLHVYHHAATAVLGFVYLSSRLTAGWVTVFLNLGVHVLMYYYYYATAGGAKLWWKQYLTTMQIAQFIVILIVGVFVLYQRVAYDSFPEYLPHIGNCAFDLSATSIVFGFAVIFSYLFLFLDFFYKTYPQKTRSHNHRTATLQHLNSVVQSPSKSSKATSGNLLFSVEKME